MNFFIFLSKNRSKTCLLYACFLLLCFPLVLGAQEQANFDIVPKPQGLKQTQETAFVLDKHTVLLLDAKHKNKKQIKETALFLQNYLQERTGFTLPIVYKNKTAKAIRLSIAPQKVKMAHQATQLTGQMQESYTISSTNEGLSICGYDVAGLFYGVQTLRKALPHYKAKERNQQIASIAIPKVQLVDAPRFAYRGTMLDVARHYITPDSLRRFVDLLALHKINRFHLHITDDQGWRMEIKSYPRLMSVASVRQQTVIGKNTEVYDGKPYGGYYTQKELCELVAYAAKRHITIIPEIDMPGHMQAALAAYPELGCKGEGYEVAQMWGVMDDVLCAGRDSTYRFIADVLKEVVQVFPSEYIHVGGDECPKTRWKTCPRCQAMIQKEQLQADDKHSAEERLQSHIIRYASKVLAGLGRKMIGWDEILEGGLASGATVMSWTGENGGFEAARQGHDAIMSPTAYMYFDYYQSKNKAQEPFAIGGYLPLQTVYNYEPVPQQLTAEQAQHIIGVQANLWTEYIKTFRHAEYMLLPRLAALAEIQWSRKADKNYEEFLQRLPRLMKLYDEANYNYARHLFDVKARYSVREGDCIVAELSTFDNAPIHYSLDGNEPTVRSPRYTAPIELRKDTQLAARAFRLGNRENPRSLQPRLLASHTERESFVFSQATTCKIQLLQGANEKYSFAGPGMLVDGLKATDTNYQSGRWIGFYTQDMDAVIDLGSMKTIQQVFFNTCVEKGAWIFDARKASVAVSTDGVNYTTISKKEYAPQTADDENGITSHRFEFAPISARFVRIVASPEHNIPDWHPGKGRPAFLFVDEIEVR